MRHIPTLSDLMPEWRTSLRGLLRRPGYAIAAWIMLGLAVAANGAVFAIVYGFLLKPLPWTHTGQLSVVRERVPRIGLNKGYVSPVTYRKLKKRLTGVANAGLANNPGLSIATIGGHRRLLISHAVTPSLYRTLGVRPLLGHLPAENADLPGAPPEAVISWQLWQNAWGGKRDVLHHTFTIKGRTYQIVGVMPRGFFIRQHVSNVWIPLIIPRQGNKALSINYWMVVRRKPGVSSRRLNIELRGLKPALIAEMPARMRAIAIHNDYTLDARPPRSLLLGMMGMQWLPWILQAASGLLLLLALANIINLSLVRQRARRHEFALRNAIGSSRAGLVRLILIEHLPIALLVGLTSTLLTGAAIATLHAFGLPPDSSPFEVALTPAVIAFAWGLTALSFLVVTIGPAALTKSRKLLAVLGHGHTANGGKAPRRIQRALGVTQISLACALVIAGGLLGASLWRVLVQPLGFSTRHRIGVLVALPHGDKDPVHAWKSLTPALQKLPGMHSSAAAGTLPFAGGRPRSDIRKIGSPENILVKTPQISPRFFSTMGIQLLAGRTFTSSEIAKNLPVVVVNQNLAKRLFGSSRNAIGRSIQLILAKPLKVRIVGVARNIAWAPTPDDYQPGTLYRPLGSFPARFRFVVDGQGSIASLEHTIRHAVARALPASMVLSMATLREDIRRASTFRAAGAGLVATFAVLALLIAALGVFAITAFIARGRLGEYGVRAALGATPGSLLRLGLGEAGQLLAYALPLGVISAYFLGTLIASTLYQTSILDPGLYAVGACAIAISVIAAAWGPARRAARTPIRNLIGGDGTQ